MRLLRVPAVVGALHGTRFNVGAFNSAPTEPVAVNGGARVDSSPAFHPGELPLCLRPQLGIDCDLHLRSLQLL